MANEKFRDKIVRVFNVEDSYDDGYDDEETLDEGDDEAMTEEATAKQTNNSAAGLAGVNVLVLDPEFFEDAPGIVNKIKENKTVVVNLKNTEYEEGRKIFDFLNGAVFALEGSINKIADNVFILAPKQVSVSTEMEEDSDKDYITPPILDFDSEE